MQRDDAAVHFDTHRGFVGQAVAAHIAHKATRTVAAVFHLTTIGVVDHVFKVHIGLGGWSHTQDLIGTDTKVSVGNELVLVGAQTQEAVGLIEHHEVIARALHFGKSNPHVPIIIPPPPPLPSHHGPPPSANPP